jgi:tRNA pseudouridine-54 N-methylase
MINKKLRNKRPLKACASCRERNNNNVCEEVRIHEELIILKLSGSQIEEWNRSSGTPVTSFSL